MSVVDFVYRRSKPANPQIGCFYWIEENVDGKSSHSVWFAPTADKKDLILLNDDFSQRIKNLADRVGKNETDIVELKKLKSEILGNIDGRNYATEEWVENKGYLTEHQSLDGYALKSEIPEPTELKEEDYDIIAEKVNNKIVSLAWKVI